MLVFFKGVLWDLLVALVSVEYLKQVPLNYLWRFLEQILHQVVSVGFIGGGKSCFKIPLDLDLDLMYPSGST